MSLRHSVFASAFCLLAAASSSVFATEYRITSTADVEALDGVCTLREAIKAISTAKAFNDCPAGSGGDRIKLIEGREYNLALGELVLGGEMTDGVDLNNDLDFDDEGETPPEEINPFVTILLDRAVFDDDPKEKPVIRASSGTRILTVRNGVSLTLTEVVLEGNGAVAQAGGLVLVEGALAANTGTEFRDGDGVDGGAIHMSGNGLLNLTRVAFFNNVASGNGGAVASAATFSGGVTVSRALFRENTAGAAGGAIYLGGDRAAMQQRNTTYYANSAVTGGAVAVATTDSVIALNNVTIAGQNNGGGLYIPASTDNNLVSLSNAVIVGNVGGSCAAGDAAALDEAVFAYVVHEGATCTPLDLEANMPDPAPGALPGDTIPNDSANADFSVLAGNTAPGLTPVIGECPTTPGAASCEPLELDETEGWQAFLPDLNGPVVPTLVNAGSPVDAVSNFCEANDQRDLARNDDCDAGAIELQIAKGEFDEFFVVAGVASVLDVAENDLGDMSLDCPTQDCVQITVPPRKGTVIVDYNHPDYPVNYPVVRYQSRAGIHGIDSFRYLINKDAVVGGYTYADADLGAQVNVVVEPATGITSDSIGGGAFFHGLALLMLGLLRRGRKLLVALLLLPSMAMSAEIVVNSLDDAVTPVFNDGFCTLREALGNAIDDAPFISPDCANGSTGRDLITLPEGVITIAAPLPVDDGSIEIQGQGATVAGVTGTTISGAGAHRIFVAGSSMVLRDLTLENAMSTGRGGAIFTSAALTLERVILRNNQAETGGAVYLNFQTTLSRTVRINTVEFINNQATVAGGAISMASQNQQLVMNILNTAFRGNVADKTGGAIDFNLAPGSSATISNSTFYQNSAVNGDVRGAFTYQGDALDVVDVAAGGRVSIMNSTFFDHANGVFALRDDTNIDANDDGMVDDTDKRVEVMVANSVFVDSGVCSTTTGVLYSRGYSVFAPYDASCEAVTEENNEDSLLAADVIPVINAGVIVDAAGEGEDFIASHFPLDANAANASALVDAGKGAPDELVSNFDSPSVCRDKDLRGVSRAAGNRCDIGAYEVERVTAVNDTGIQGNNRGRYVIIDVLANDQILGNEEILTDTIDLDPTSDSTVELTFTTPVNPDPGYTQGGTVRVVQRDDIDADCGVNDPFASAGGDCVVRYDAPPDLSCALIKGFSDSFTYQFFTTPTTSQPSVEGTVDVELSNVAPLAPAVKVVAKPGQTLVLPFVIDDPDATPGFVITDVTISDKPINAKGELVDGEWVYLGVGIIVDVEGGKVTYVPAGQKPFTERFTLTYKDECGASGSTRFEIQYPQDQVSGDFIGSGSISPWLFLVPLLLLGRRRRLKS